MQHPANAAMLSQPSVNAARVLFWVGFYGVGALSLLLSLRSLGATSPIALLLQASLAIWALAGVLHVCRRRESYAVAGFWAVLLGLPLSVQVMQRLHYWLTIGMEPPDGMGSPMAFLAGFVIEWLIFAPLCVMLLILLVARPWRPGRPADVAGTLS
jgi:hypothetical protein